MFTKSVVYVDIETTGMGYRSNRIIEFAAIRVEGGVVVDEVRSLVNPATYLSPYITSITGISETDLEDAPYFEEIAGNIARICDDAIFVAHNVRFDYSFIKNQMEACGYKFSPQLLCTVRLSRALYPEERSHKLESLIVRHGIKVANRHRAYEDARALWEFCKLAYSSKGQEVFDAAVSKQVKHRSLPPNLSDEILSQISNGPGVYTFEDENGKPLYIGKSINLKKRIMSHFTQDTKEYKEMKISLGVHNVSTIETSNELEALLLESKLVKEKLPLYNRQLRRVRDYVALLKGENDEGYTTISINAVDIAGCEDTSMLYGLYETRTKAKNALLEHQKTYSLCPRLLGLEKGKGACFQYQLKKCSGPCAGKIEANVYNLKVELALQKSKIAAWPFKGPILLRHKNTEDKPIVIDQWRIDGEYQEDGTIKRLDSHNRGFNLDTYKILRNYLNTKKNELIIIPYSYSLG